MKKKKKRGKTFHLIQRGDQERVRHMKRREGGSPWKEKRVVISKGAQYHNPDVVTRLSRPRNIARVEINGVKTRALMDSGLQVNMMTDKFLETVGLTLRPLADLGLKLGIERSAGTNIPYLGYTEASLKLPTANNYCSDQLFSSSGAAQYVRGTSTNTGRKLIFQDEILGSTASARPGRVGR